ncbi:MAG: hypothetical protein VKI83_00265, partial [Synechococcaceae cyanobacterium]|nr:hypothetical protein [Synechococcaceae cyanobacterium]
MVTLQSSSSLNPSAIFSQLQDLVGSDTTLLGPLRDLLARPAFRQLIGARPVSLSLGGREALLQELSLVYHPAMLERLAAIIDGVLGLPPGALPSQQNSTLGSLASPAVQDTATPSSNHSSRNAALIGLLAMLAGAGAVA